MKFTGTILTTFLLLACAFPLMGQGMKIGDTSKNNGKVEWLPRQITTGDVPYGIPVERTFSVKNISTDDLLILNVKSGCHCTVVNWTKEPVPPGMTGTIKITYDALKVGDFYKIISVITNFDPETNLVLSMTGTVLPLDKTGQ